MAGVRAGRAIGTEPGTTGVTAGAARRGAGCAAGARGAAGTGATGAAGADGAAATTGATGIEESAQATSARRSPAAAGGEAATGARTAGSTSGTIGKSASMRLSASATMLSIQAVSKRSPGPRSPLSDTPRHYLTSCADMQRPRPRLRRSPQPVLPARHDRSASSVAARSTAPARAESAFRARPRSIA